MAFARNHAFVSGVADGGNAALLQPSYWNQALVVSGATVGGIPYCPTATTETTSANLLYTETSGPRLQVGSGAAATQGWILGTALSGSSFQWPTSVTPTSANYVLRSDGTTQTALQGLSVYLGSGNSHYWKFTNEGNNLLAIGINADSGISRLGAGSLAIGNGTAGSFAGDLKLTTLTADGLIITKGYAVGSLPAGVTGAIAYVTDQLTAPAAKGVAPTAGGSVVCPVFYNGAAWVGA